MGARLRLWWQQIKTHPVATVLIALVIALVVLVSLGGYLFHWDWTGFNGDIKSGKTLWDWLQLLIIPAVLATGGYVFSLTMSRNEQKATEQRNKTEHEVAEDNQCEAALQGYIDKISELLLEKHLRESQPEDEVRTIARAHTLTALPRLDSWRKRSLLQFLYESGLIEKDKGIINLLGADVSGANLLRAYLPGVRLSGANLQEAILTVANLYEADLSRAYLSGAKMNLADLRGADLRDADLSLTNPFVANPFRATPNVSDLYEVDFGPADLRGARLNGANLSGANLSRTILWNAHLSRAKLMHTCLHGTNLISALLDGADLRDADLSGADLSGAILTGAKVTQKQWEKAKSLEGATMPDGSIHP